MDSLTQRAAGFRSGRRWCRRTSPTPRAELPLFYAETKIEYITHPPAYDRLFQVMEKHVHDGGNLPWAFVQSVLALHLQNQGIPHDADRKLESFKDAADYFVDVISKMFR